MYVIPIILYVAPTWAPNISTTSWKKLEALQSTTLRVVTSSPWYVFNETIRNSLKINSI